MPVVLAEVVAGDVTVDDAELLSVDEAVCVTVLDGELDPVVAWVDESVVVAVLLAGLDGVGESVVAPVLVAVLVAVERRVVDRVDVGEAGLSIQSRSPIPAG